jgi:glycosyltransferase involved in cell wall biosynthesis
MLTVIIPAYNEEKIIQNTIDNIFAWSKTSLLEINLVIINNNSTDSTESILKKNSLEKKSLVYKNEEKQGKGFAIKAGLALASKNVLILDADLSVSIDQFQTKWLELKNTAISGSRFMGKVQGTPARRLLTGKCFSWIVKKYFNMTVDDTQCGFKFISYENMSTIKENLTVGNFAYDIDLLLTMKKLNIDLINTPVTYIHNDDSSVRILRDSVKMFMTILKLKRKFN